MGRGRARGARELPTAEPLLFILFRQNWLISPRHRSRPSDTPQKPLYAIISAKIAHGRSPGPPDKEASNLCPQPVFVPPAGALLDPGLRQEVDYFVFSRDIKL